MAAKKKNISLPFLKEYNIDKMDLIIYAVSLGLFIVAIVSFFLINGDIKVQKQQTKAKSAQLEEYRKLQQNKSEIETDASKLKDRAQSLYDRFLSEEDISNFSYFVSETAKRYKGAGVNIDPAKKFTSETRSIVLPDDVADYLVKKNVFRRDQFSVINSSEQFPDGGQRVNLKFLRLPVRVNMEISFGNFVAFLYCLENSSKFVEVSNLAIYGSADSEKLRIDLTISCFGKNKEFSDQVYSVLPPDTKLIESPNKVQIPFPKVEKERKPAILGQFEKITYASGPVSVRNVFNPPMELKCPELCPGDLKLEALVGDVVAFSSGGTTFFAKKGQNLRTKMGLPITNFPNLKLLDVKDKKVILQNTDANKDNPECPSTKPFSMK